MAANLVFVNVKKEHPLSAINLPAKAEVILHQVGYPLIMSVEGLTVKTTPVVEIDKVEDLTYVKTKNSSYVLAGV